MSNRLPESAPAPIPAPPLAPSSELAPGLTPLLAVPKEMLVTHPPRDRYWLHALLLLGTIVTTLMVGAGMQFNFQSNFVPYADGPGAAPSFFPVEWILARPSRLFLGIPFSATLLLILLCHEMGHYFYCQKYRVGATLPFFIPFPSLAGTVGAFIRIRGAIRSRAALFDIGIAGPIAGFIPALVAVFIGLWLSEPLPPVSLDTVTLQFGHPLIFSLAQSFLGAATNAQVFALPLDRLYLHPVAFAAWVGMVVTSFNLLPGGQLDGGHIVYALFPRAHRLVTLLTAGVLIPLGMHSIGWWLWAVVLLATGWQHPPVPPWPGLDRRRKLLALLVPLLLFLSLTPVPVRGFSAAEVFPKTFGPNAHWRGR